MAFAAELDSARTLLEEIADAAGAVVRRYFRTPFEVDDKADATPVTIADREAESAIRRLIERRFPAHGIVGEEHGSERPGAEFVWTIDPIDGTGLFISGIPLFGTLVALLFEGVPVLGLIDQPILRERWIGCRDRPTTLNGAAVRTRPCESLEVATAFATTPAMFRGADADAFGRVRARTKRMRYGADCYAYGLLAAGHIDLVVEADLKPWDYCAHLPIITGAGGSVTDWAGAVPGLGSDGRIIAAGDARTHATALAVLAKLSPS